MKNLLIKTFTLVTFLLCFTVVSLAQDKSKPAPTSTPSESKAPADVVLSKEVAEKLDYLRLIAENKILRAKDLKNEIEKAQKELDLMYKDAEKAFSDLSSEQTSQLIKQGVPSEAVGQYEFFKRNENGSVVLRKKAEQKP